MRIRSFAERLLPAALIACAGCSSSRPAAEPPAPAPYLHPSTTLIREPMPGFEGLVRLNGRADDLPPLRGVVTVVELGDTTCAGCAKLAPGLDALSSKFPAGKVRLVRVIDGRVDTEEAARRHVEQAKSSEPVLRDPGGSLFERAGVTACPAVFVVGADGRIVWWQSTARIELVEEWVADALAQTPR